MKNLIPIKRHQAFVAFSRDHHFGLLLSWKIRQGLHAVSNPGRITNYLLFFFEESLRQHFREEEQYLFNKLPVDDPLRSRAEAEHRNIYRLVQSLRVRKTDKDLLNEFADTLEQHIRFEERTFFNHLQEHVESGMLEGMPAHPEQSNREMDDRWDDKFWEIKK
jgi:iron-sulfur cluster repair protein YtfE (RIC family)